MVNEVALYNPSNWVIALIARMQLLRHNFRAKELFFKKIPQARINENATSAILRIQEKGIDFQGKKVLKRIFTDFFECP